MQTSWRVPFGSVSACDFLQDAQPFRGIGVKLPVHRRGHLRSFGRREGSELR